MDIGPIISAIDDVISFLNDLRKKIDKAYVDTIIATDYKDDNAKKHFFEFYEAKLKIAKEKVGIMKKFSDYINKNYKEKRFLDYWELLGRYFDKTYKRVQKAKKKPPKDVKGLDKIIEIRDDLQFRKDIFTIIENSVSIAEDMQEFFIRKKTMKKL